MTEQPDTTEHSKAKAPPPEQGRRAIVSARYLPLLGEYRWQCKWEAWVVGVPAFDFFVWHPVAGGIIVAGEVTTEECEQMAERAAVVDGLVQKWVEILTERAA